MTRWIFWRSVRSPDFGAQEPEAALNEPVVQVGEHDVVAACGGVRIECDRAAAGRCEGGEARSGTAARRGPRIGAHAKAWGRLPARRDELGLPGQIQSDMHHGFDIRRE